MLGGSCRDLRLLKPILETVGYSHRCACGEVHSISIKPGQEPRWYLVGNDANTGRFHPSVRTGSGCHYTINGGAQVFEQDSTTRPGETVPIAS